MGTTALNRVWHALLSPYTRDERLIAQELDHIIARYSAAGRYYHNLLHLQALLQLQEAYAAAIRDNEVIQFAIFYHDVIYDVQQNNNEEESALAAGRFLQQTAFPADRTALVMQYIRATKLHSGNDNDEDLCLFLDFDLSILSSPADAYRQYAQQIRQEYQLYPDEVYNAGRRKVLAHFLEMPFIYRSPAFREQYEAQARENIKRELADLP